MKKQFLIPLLVAIAGIAYFAITATRHTPVPSSLPEPEVNTSQLLTDLAGELEIQPHIQDYAYFDWITAENKRLPLTGKSFLVGTTDVNGIGKYRSFTDITQITESGLKPIQDTTTAFFRKEGFAESTTNTRRTGLAPAESFFLGFEKADTKCIVRLDVQTDPFGNFFCGEINQEQLKSQEQFEKMFEDVISQEGPMSFRVEKVDGDFAIGSAVADYSGYTWMAKKTNDIWEIIWRGNEIALCSDMTRLGIPQEIYGDCYQE